MKKMRAPGFTLLEILVALFIFSILSVMLAGGLRSVIRAQAGTEENAERLRQMQMAFLLMSRDVEQAVNRPIVNTNAKEEGAFIGTPTGFTFTHGGYASTRGSIFQRTRYVWMKQNLWRVTWDSLDQAPQTKGHNKLLLNNIVTARFEYMDPEGRLKTQWPANGETKQPLPSAVRITLTVANWGNITQLYVIPLQIKKTQPST